MIVVALMGAFLFVFGVIDFHDALKNKDPHKRIEELQAEIKNIENMIATGVGRNFYSARLAISIVIGITGVVMGSYFISDIF